MTRIRKYPRTQHILDSELQPGDEEANRAGFDAIAGRHLVVEEKVDGANCAMSFDADGRLLLQSRGHYLTGGGRERHFDLLKSWAHGLSAQLWPVIGARYIVYGEWVYAKHTIYYDRLPHYFLEFDVLDTQTETFLSTPRRKELLSSLPIHSVPVLHTGLVKSPAQIKSFIAPSAFKSAQWRASLSVDAGVPPHDPELVTKQTDGSDFMEGLYLKVEENGAVAERYKYVRHDFLTCVLDSESHWQSRPILPNRLAEPADSNTPS
jgi:hypothetical protein